MHVLIFGPTGGVGKALVTLALSRGMKVTAFARKPEKVPSGADVIVGDALDERAVANAITISSPDAVLISLGSSGIMSRDFNCSKGTANIYLGLRAAKDAMRARGGAPKSPRVVVCSSMGVGDSAPFIPGFVAWLLKHALADKEPQEATVRDGGFPWVIVRPTGLRDAPPRGRAALAAIVGGKLPTSSISRTDVADFMLEALEKDDFLGKSVGLSWSAA